MTARNFLLGRWITELSRRAGRQRSSEKDIYDDEEFGDIAHDEATAEVRLSELLARFSARKAVSAAVSRDDALVASYTLGRTGKLALGYATIERHIVAALKNSDARMRSRGLKGLSAIVEADCSVLAADSVKRAVSDRFIDSQISVREAAVELVGRFVLQRPDLIDHYFDIFMQRLKDSGTSVRKRVIRILGDICIQQQGYHRIPEICARVLGRIRQQEGDRDLIVKVFREMWFTTVSGTAEDKAMATMRRANCIMAVFADKTTVMRNFGELISAVFDKKDKDASDARAVCQDIVDIMMEKVLSLEEQGKVTSIKAYLGALNYFCQAEPRLMINHYQQLSPYLKLQTSAVPEIKKSLMWILYYAAQMIREVLPLLKHPSPDFLVRLKESLGELILSSTTAPAVIEVCTECLKNSIEFTEDIDFAREILEMCYNFLNEHVGAAKRNALAGLQHAMFVSGLMCKNFEFDAETTGQTSTIRDLVLDILIFYANDSAESLLQVKAVQAVGNMLVRHVSMMTRKDVQDLYIESFTRSANHAVEVLKNVAAVLMAEEARALAAQNDTDKTTDLMEIGDEDSGVIGIIILHLKEEILQALLSSVDTLRREALAVAQSILKQGLIHPIECVPQLIALTSDTVVMIRDQAKAMLKSVIDRHPDFVVEKAVDGARLTYTFRKALMTRDALKDGVVRGHEVDAAGVRTAVLGPLYGFLSLHKKKTQARRALITGMLRLFDFSSSSKALGEIGEQRFIADNLCHFAYQQQEEALFVINGISSMVSVDGSFFEQTFKQQIGYTSNDAADDLDDTVEQISARIGSEVSTALQKACVRAQSFGLLLQVKQFLQIANGFTERRCEEYNPKEHSKLNDVKIFRRASGAFEPACIISTIGSKDVIDPDLAAAQYVQFRDMMLHGQYPEFGLEEKPGKGESEDVHDATEVTVPKSSSVSKVRRQSNGNGSRKGKAVPKKKGKQTTKKRRRRIGDSDDDDDDDDDEWH